MTSSRPDDISVETSIELEVQPEEAWASLERLREDRVGGDAEAETWWLPGFVSRATELEREPGRYLSVRKDEEPCAGTTISIVLEHTATGSRIRVVQSGFDPAFVHRAGEHFWLHAEHIFADLELFFRAGVLGGRAWRWPEVALGLTARTVGRTVEISHIDHDSWAGRVGLAAGDRLLVLGGAPLYGIHDLQTVCFALHPGTEVEATWSRSGELHSSGAGL